MAVEEMISHDAIAKRIGELAARISDDYAGKEIFAVCILKGSVYFTADITRRISVPCKLNFIKVSSYDGTQTTGRVNIDYGSELDISGRDVLIIEDIIDTGTTLGFLKSFYAGKSPASLKILTLLDKPSRRLTDITPDYCGFVIEDKFVVGYGMDCNEKYRNLDYIGIYSE